VTGTIRRFALARFLLGYAILPAGLLIAVTLAAAILIARQNPGPVIITSLPPERFTTTESIGIFEPGHQSFELRITLPGSYRAAPPSVISRRYILFTRFGGTPPVPGEVLHDLFTGREILIPSTRQPFLSTSPDRTLATIVIRSDASVGGALSGDLIVIDVAAWETHVIASGTFSEPMAWSRDQRLAYIRDGILYVTAPGGANPQPVSLPDPNRILLHQFAPDGMHLAVMASDPATRAVVTYLVDTASGDVRPVTTSAPNTSTNRLTWSPDSQNLLAIHGARNRLDVAVVDVATGSVRALTADLPDTMPRAIMLEGMQSESQNPIHDVGWSPDGKRLAASIVTGYSPFGSALILIDLERDTLIPFGSGTEFIDTWSSDGRYLHVQTLVTGGGVATIYAYSDGEIELSSRTTLPDIPAGDQTVPADVSIQWLYRGP
jgi:Tol biopolymer transport system component